MKNFILSLFIVFSINNLQAQFEFTGGPNGDLVVSMSVADSATYIVTLHSVYRSFDDGNTWENIFDIPMYSSLLSSTSFGLEVNWLIKAYRNKVTLYYYEDIELPPFKAYHLLWSENYGTTWQEGNFPTVDGVPQVFSPVRNINDSLIFTQRGKKLFYTQDFTNSWQVKLLPDSTYGFIFDNTDIYYWNQDSIYHCTNFPNEWQAYPMGIPVPIASIKIRNGVLFVRSTDPVTGHKSVWTSKGISQDWVERPEFAGCYEFDALVKGDSVFLWPRFLWESNRLWVSDTSMTLFVRDENRKTPVHYDNTFGINQLLGKKEALYLFTTNDFFSSYDDHFTQIYLWRSTDNGLNWRVPQTGIGEPLINDYLFDTASIWVCTPHGIFRKANDGLIWEKLDTIKRCTYSIEKFDNAFWKISEDSLDIKIFRSDDNGNNWTEDFWGINEHLVGTPDALFFNVGLGYLYRRLPQENTWVDISSSLPDELSDGVLDVYFHGKVFLYDGHGKLYASEDLGQSWQIFPVPSSLHPRLLSVVNDTLYYVGARGNGTSTGYYYELYKWNESEGSWIFISDELELDYSWQEEYYIRQITGLAGNGNRLFLGIRGHGIYQSFDGGHHWEVVSEDDAARNTIGLVVSNNWLYNISQFFGVWKMWLEPSSSPDLTTDYHCNIFPNPTKGVFNIELPHKNPAETELRVFTISGQLIYKHSYYTSDIKLDLSELSSGTYIISIGNNGHTQGYSIIQLLK